MSEVPPGDPIGERDADVPVRDADVPVRDADVPERDADAPVRDADAPVRDADIAARAYRRRFRDKGNKREDWAIDVFREVFAHLDEPDRVDRLLFELGRYYNALADGPVVDLATRRRVAECLAGGAVEEAKTLLQDSLDRYRGGIDDGLEAPDR